MSYMSSLESKARNAYAIEILNKLRHKLTGRSSEFNSVHANVLLDSLELNEGGKLSSKYIQFGLYGLNNYQEASALELSELIKSTSVKLSTKDGDNKYLAVLKDYLTNKKYESSELILNDKENELILDLINSAIDNLYSASISESGMKSKEFKGI
jgi:hypothetical protein